MTATLSPLPVFQWINSQGQPLVGGQLFSYQAGTSTPLNTYKDVTGTAANTNPTILDASGSAQVWLGSSNYKLVLKDTFGNVQWTVDNINAIQMVFLPLTGGALYQAATNTTLDINSDAGLTSSLVTQIGGVNSTRFYSTTQGVGGLTAADGSGNFGVDAITFDEFGNVTIGFTLKIGSNTAIEPQFQINGAQGATRLVEWLTAGVLRWSAYADADAESGSDSGSSFAIAAYHDNGTFIGNAVRMVRATLNATTGGVWTGPNFVATSDRRLKKGEKPLKESDAIKWVKAFKAWTYRLRSNGRKDIGFMADEMHIIKPELVHEDANGYQGIDYDKIVPIHNSVLQSLLRRVEALEKSRDAAK